MNEEQTLLRHIVLPLVKRHERWLNDAASPSDFDLYSQIVQRFGSPFRHDELEGALRGAPLRFSTADRVAFLDQVPDAGLVLPALALSYDFTQRVPEATLQLGLFKMDRGQPVALGFRFEVPHGWGSHNYYHAQPVQALLRSRRLQLPCPSWLPTACPTLPFNALNVGTLLICMVVSLYGMEYLQDLETQGFRDILRRYTKDMHWFDGRPARLSRFSRDDLGRWRQQPR